VFDLENELYASFQNIGFLKYESSELKNLNVHLKPLSISKMEDHKYLVGGFFEEIKKAGCNESVLYNHVGILDFNAPSFEIEIETLIPCTDEYVYLDINTTLLDYEVEWIVDGSIFGTSEIDCPILRYFEPGIYPITAIVHHANGSDTLHSSITISTDCLTSISQNHLNQSINVWPNPASDYIYIKGHDQLKSIIEVYDISGQKLFSEHIPVGTEQYQLSIVDLHDGYYFLSVKSDQSILGTRFVKASH